MLDSLAANPDPALLSAASHRRILASAAMLGTATVLVKLVAFIKDLLVADVYGAGDTLDAFLVAFLVPSFGVTVLASSFAPAFIPTYIRVLERQGAAAARRLAGGALAANSGLLVALAQSLLYVVVGVLVASGLSAVFSAVLNANDRFVMSAVAPLAVPTATAATFWTLYDRFGIYALAGGTLLGFVIECVALGCAAYGNRLLPWPGRHGFDENLRLVASRFLPVAVGSMLISSSVVVDQSMAASLGTGNVSILNYGNKIVSLLLGIVAISLSTVLFPRFSRLITAGQWEGARRTMRVYSLVILVVSIPCAAIIALGAEPIIRLLFERGKFTADATHAAAQVQAWLALQIPFYVLVMLGFRVLSALDSQQIILRVGALNLALNIVGDLVLMRWFGVAGIAMSTSLVYLIAAIATLAAIKLRMAEVSTA